MISYVNSKLLIIYRLLYIKQITYKHLLYSTENYIQYIVITYNRKESKKIFICEYIKIWALPTADLEAMQGIVRPGIL